MRAPRIAGHLVTLALTLTAAGLAVVAGRRLWTGGAPSWEPPPQRTEYVDEWEDALAFATQVVGDDTARVTILALTDLQCPACRAFHEASSDLLSERPEGFRLLYVHHPLTYHPSAWTAARGAECALIQHPDGFVRWVNAVFAGQDSIGSRPWMDYATDAQLPDPSGLEACINSAVADGRIQAGLSFGTTIQVTGTPTVLVNGWKYLRPPTVDELRAIVDSLSVGPRAG